MEPGNYDLVIHEGAGLVLPLVWETEDDQGVLQAVDLTGYVARADLRENYDSVTPKLQLSSTNGKITLDNAGGIVIRISKADGDSLGAHFKGVWDLILTAPDGVTYYPILLGSVTIERHATR